jgi:serine/threonine-protein kinase
MPTTPDTALTRDQFLAAVRASGVLSDRQFAKAQDAVSLFTRSARAVADELVAGGFLTRFQAERLLTGRADGFLLGPYIVLDYLGKTDVARLYKARHRTMNRLAAVHVLKAELTASAAVRDAIRTQARAAARLAHPNVVTLLDVNAVGDRMYLVREFLDGTDLGAMVQAGGPVTARRACEFGRQAAVGLQHAHEKDTFHGRLTPASVLVGRPGGTGPEDKPVVKVAGLGMGRFTGERCDSGFEYLAPEQFADPHRADVTGDLYALGCVLHLLLVGRPPFPAPTLYDAAANHTGTPVTPIRYLQPAVPPPVAALVERLLAKDPSARPASAEEVAAVLEPFAAAADSFASIDFSLPEPAALGPVSRAELTCVADAPNPWAEITGGTDPEPSGVAVSDHTQVVQRPWAKSRTK